MVIKDAWLSSNLSVGGNGDQGLGALAQAVDQLDGELLLFNIALEKYCQCYLMTLASSFCPSEAVMQRAGECA